MVPKKKKLLTIMKLLATTNYLKWFSIVNIYPIVESLLEHFQI